ncbi:MAG: hypothetical protein EPO26_07615 [Chloroflexota bacterium]|nr:MAG: hypothetical protein EPO26_07615 [Chloroflexota bacterium]
MPRATITLPDELQGELQRYLADLESPVPVSRAVQAAIREYLARRGYGTSERFQPLRITPSPTGSGSTDVSTEHDRYLADSLSAE